MTLPFLLRLVRYSSWRSRQSSCDWVVDGIRINPWLLNCNNIRVKNCRVTEELRHDDILRPVHVVLKYGEFVLH